jgi:RsiW-degrading membrane proteinase PrsW (M82 family)
MHPLAAGVLGFVPGVLWLWFVWEKDTHEPEPRHLVLGVFALGCAAALAGLLVRPWLEPLAMSVPAQCDLLVDAFIVTAASEEILKGLAIGSLVWWHRELDEPLDGIVYGAAAGLGFASLENAIYLAAIADPTIVLVRAFTAMLLHAACSSALGFCLILARDRIGGRRWCWTFAGLATPILLHGTYDYFLLSDAGLDLIALLGALPLAAALLSAKIRWSRARSPHYHALP